MAIQVKYNCLCDEFLSTVDPYIDRDALQILKDYYAECINSKRKLSKIKDLKGLISVLQKRDILSYENIEPLCYISKKFLIESHLHNQLSDYACTLQSVGCLPLYNMYQDDNICPAALQQKRTTNKSSPLSPTENRTPQSVHCHVASAQPQPCTSRNLQDQQKNNAPNIRSQIEGETALQQIILSRVSDRLGRSWRDVARHLGIRECEIDAIQNKYPYDLKEQSYEALKVFVSHYGSNKWKLALMQALEKGRRRDLKEIVEELIREC